MKTSSILIVCLLVLLSLLVLKICGDKQIERVEIVKFDTIEVIKPVEKIVVQKAKPKIRFVRDTIVLSQPFVAQLDTIVRSDTISARYSFPENIFDIEIARKADTVRVPKIVVAPKEKRSHWLDKVGTFVVGLAFGFLLGKIK